MSEQKRLIGQPQGARALAKEGDMHASRAGHPEDGGHRRRGRGQEGLSLPAEELRPNTQMRDGGLLKPPGILPRGGDQLGHAPTQLVVEEIRRSCERVRLRSGGRGMVTPGLLLGSAVLGGEAQSHQRRVTQRGREEHLTRARPAGRLGASGPHRRGGAQVDLGPGRGYG